VSADFSGKEEEERI